MNTQTQSGLYNNKASLFANHAMKTLSVHLGHIYHTGAAVARCKDDDEAIAILLDAGYVRGANLTFTALENTQTQDKAMQWKATPNKNGWFSIVDNDGHKISRKCGSKTAALIVRAVNEHAALDAVAEAAEALLPICDGLDLRCQYSASRQALRNALEAVRKGGAK